MLLAIGEFDTVHVMKWRIARAVADPAYGGERAVDSEAELRRVLSVCGLLSMFYGDGAGPFEDGVSYWTGPSGMQYLPLMSFPACPIGDDHHAAAVAAYEAAADADGAIAWLAKAVALALDECEYPTFAVTR